MKILMRAVITLMLVAAICAAVSPVVLADISGTGLPVQVAASGTAIWVQFQAPAGNMSLVRYGDSSTTCGAIGTGRGAWLVAGSGGFYPPIAPDAQQPLPGLQHYALNTIYYCVASGDKVTISWAQ